MLELKLSLSIGVYFTKHLPQQGILSEQTLSKTATELRYIEISLFMAKLNNQNLRNFEVGTQESMNVPIWNIVGVQRKHRQE